MEVEVMHAATNATVISLQLLLCRVTCSEETIIVIVI